MYKSKLTARIIKDAAKTAPEYECEPEKVAHKMLDSTCSAARHGARPCSTSAMGGIAYLPPRRKY